MAVIRTYRDVFGPRFFIEADNSFAEDIIAHTLKFEYEDHDNKIDRLQLTVANPGLRFTDDTRFLESVRFRLRWGYPNDMSSLRSVTLAKARPAFPENGQPTIELVAFDLRQDMNKKANPFNWGAVSSSDVAKKIADRYLLNAKIEPSGDARKEMRVQPANTTDLQYLMKLAEKLDFDCFIDDATNTLHFHKKDYKATPSLEFMYFTDDRSTMLAFAPDVDLTKPPAIGTASTDQKKGTSHSTEGSNRVVLGREIDTNNARYTGRKVQLGGSGILHPTNESDRTVADIHANALKQKMDMKAVKATLSVVGTPRLKARQIIRLTGVGTTYSGNWRVSGTRHVIDGKSYVCTVQLTRNGLGGKPTDKKKDSNTKGVHDPAMERFREINSNQVRFTGTVNRVVTVEK